MDTTRTTSRRFFSRGRPGAAPGTIRKRVGDYSIRTIAYDNSKVDEQVFDTAEAATSSLDEKLITWVDVVGIDSKLLRQIGRRFGIHPLSLEDVVNIGQRAKWEHYENYDYFVMQMVSDVSDDGVYAVFYQSEQLSIIHSGNVVITIQQYQGDCLEPLRNRIREDLGFIRRQPSDYLVYAIIDTVIDYYFPVIDRIGEQLDALDAQLMQGTTIPLEQIHAIRGQLLDLGRWLRPCREMINRVLRDEGSWMSDGTRLFLRDCYDHVVQLTETIETCREICSDLRAYHLAAVSNRTNDVMKTLTIVSTIFIPLGFLAGLYGMNFEHMPELRWRWGYFALLATMLLIAGGLIFWFRRRGWFQ